LATVIDTYSRKLAGYALADHMRVSLVVDALAHAHGVRGSLDGAVFHSDHGSVYTSQTFRSYCSSLGVRQSMGAVGTSADNALAESFNATLKREVLRDRKVFDNPIACRQEVFRWCMRYNIRRRHSWCNLVAPRYLRSTHISYTDQSSIADPRRVHFPGVGPGNMAKACCPTSTSSLL